MRKLIPLLLMMLIIMGMGQLQHWPDWSKYKNWIDKDTTIIDTLDNTPPLAPYITLDTLGYDSIKITLDFLGDATLDSFFVRGSDVGYPSSKTSGTEILSGAIGDTVNEIHYEYPLAQSSKTYYLRVFVQDTVPNTAYRSVSKADLVPPDTFETAIAFEIDSVAIWKISWKPSEIEAADLDSFYFEIKAWGAYFGSYDFGIDQVGIDTLPTCTTVYGLANVCSPIINVSLEDSCLRYIIPDSLPDLSAVLYSKYIFMVASDTEYTAYVIPILKDSSGNLSKMDTIYHTWKHYQENPLPIKTIHPSEYGDSTVVEFNPSAFVFKNSSWADADSLYFGTSIHSPKYGVDTWTTSDFYFDGLTAALSDSVLTRKNKHTTSNDSVYASSGSYIWSMETGNELYWIINKSVLSDTLPFLSLITSIFSDTNGIDSIDVIASGYDDDTDSTFAYATLTQDAKPSKDSMTTALADTSHNDSLLTWTFASGLTDEDIIYVYVGVQDINNNIVWDSTSVIVPDMWGPEAGILAYFNFVPPYNDSLSIDSSLTADAVSFQIEVKKSAKDSWTTLGYLANTDVDSSFYLSGKLSYVGVDTQFLSLTWFDEEDNASTSVLDTILPTGSPNSYIYLGTYDSTHTVLDSFKILINDSAISSTADVFVIDAADTITGTSNDTLIVNLPDTLFTQNPDTTYIWSIIIFTAGESPDTSDIATYPERSLPVEDNNPPNIRGTIELTYSPTDSFTITPTGLTSDSADFDRFIFVVYEEDGDSLYYIQYSNPASSYTFNFTNEPANYSWANDSAFAKVYALDEADNRSAAIWDTLVLGWDWIKAVCDTERHALSWLRIYRNPSDSTLSGCDSLYQLSMEDVDTTTVDGDTIRIPIPEDLRYAYFNVKGMFSGNWSEGFDAWQYFEEVTIPSNFVISAAGDSDTVNVAITKFGSDFVADTARIQYATNGAYPSTRTSGTNLWAGNPSTDSTQINNDNFTINVSDGDTVWARMFLGHKGNNHWNTETKSDTAYFPPLSPPAAGDCTFAWHCESTGDIRNEDPPGYSVGDVTPTVNSGAIITSARYSDGDSCVSIPTSYDRMEFAISSGDIVSADSGTFQCDFMVDDLTTSAEFFYFFNIDADNYFKLIGHASYNDELVLRWEGQNTLTNCTTTAANIQADTWYTLIIKWRIGSVTPNLSITINGHTVTANGITPLSTAPTTLLLGQNSGTNHPWFFDNVKIWKYWRD